MYLAQCTRPNIAFFVNLRARYSSALTQKHWIGIKHILRYLRGTTDSSFVGHADSSYLSNPHKVNHRQVTCFLVVIPSIFWRFTKQTLVATSFDYAEILALLWSQ